jgi:hypothetical protein
MIREFTQKQYSMRLAAVMGLGESKDANPATSRKAYNKTAFLYLDFVL